MQAFIDWLFYSTSMPLYCYRRALVSFAAKERTEGKDGTNHMKAMNLNLIGTIFGSGHDHNVDFVASTANAVIDCIYFG